MVFLIFWSNISDLRQFFLFLALCDVMSGFLRPAAPAVSRAADLIFCLQGAKNKESKVNVPRHMLVCYSCWLKWSLLLSFRHLPQPVRDCV